MIIAYVHDLIFSAGSVNKEEIIILVISIYLRIGHLLYRFLSLAQRTLGARGRGLLRRPPGLI